MAVDNASVLISGFYHLVVSQVSTRLLTFLLNLLTTRLLTPEEYGLGSIQFHLINTTILILSREGFRRGCLRIPAGPNGQPPAKKVLAMASLCLPLGLLVTCGTCGLAWMAADKQAAEGYRLAVLLQGAAALLELASEPLYILAQAQLRFRLRMGTECAAVVVRGAAQLALLKLSMVPPAVALSLGQIAYGGVISAGFAAAYAGDGLRWLRTQHSSGGAAPVQPPAGGLKPQPTAATGETVTQQGALRQRKPRDAAGSSPRNIDPSTKTGGGSTADVKQQQPRNGSKDAVLDLPTLWLTGTYIFQAAEKQALAEGSKFVMAATQTATAQGVYGLVSNLGSLIVRTLFQPVEEAAFLAFSRAAETSKGSGKADVKAAAKRGDMLAVLVRCVSILGLLAVAFGPNYTYVLLRIVYGERWSSTDAPAALGAYCGYIPLLAANGVLEAFVHATADSRQLTAANVWLIGFWAAHVALSVVLVQGGGAQGLILADAINMAMRILYSLHFVRHTFAEGPPLPLRSLFPSTQTLLALASAGVATRTSLAVVMPDTLSAKGGASWADPLAGLLPGTVRHGGFWPQAGLHVSVGVACLAVAASVIYRAEHQLWVQVRALRHG